VTLSHAKKSPRDYGTGYRDELERFKTAINLTEYAASQVYQLDKRASSRNSVVMRHPAGDKVVIARGEDQHWIYFSVRDDADKGSIIDFIQHRRRCNLADVRRELRPWVGGAVPRIEPELYMPAVVPVSRDRVGEIFRAPLDEDPLRDLRMALNRDQPIGNDRFYAEIRAATGQRRELRKRGRPRKEESGTGNRQNQLELPF
jgi:hypothetical protein